MSLFTPQALNWLSKVLEERFGYKFILMHESQGLKLILRGSEQEGSIIFPMLESAFHESRSDFPCAQWDAEAEGLQSILNKPLPMPCVDELPQPLIEIKQEKLALKTLQPLVNKANRKALELQVIAYDAIGSNNDAIKVAKQLYKEYPQPIYAHRLFLILKKNRKVEEGFLVLENHLKNNNNINIRKIIASEYLEHGNHTQAEKFYTVLAQEFKDADAYRQLAVIRSQQGAISEGLELAQNAYTLDANSPSIAATYGWLLVQSGQAEQGLPLLRFANARDSRQPTLMFRLAETLLILKQPRQAKTLFEKAITYDFPDKHKAVIRLSEL